MVTGKGESPNLRLSLDFLEQENLIPALAALQSPSLGIWAGHSFGVLGRHGFVTVLLHSD